MMRSSVVVLFLCCWQGSQQSPTTFISATNDCVASTKTNDFIGYLAETYDNSAKFCSFLGIKYGTAERYRESEPYKGLPKKVIAQKDGPACVQLKGNVTFGSEDCHYLSVHTPNVTGSLPVIVYIHGGGYAIGTSALTYQKPDFFMETEKVVMVFIQYRLGVLGFVDFNSNFFPSNLGLKDQTLALKWVRENIGYFGGDPERVTIQGESAGASSVSLHMYSPLSKGLFRAGISESGSACCSWAVAPKAWARQRLRQLATIVKCPSDDIPEELIMSADETARCLQQKSAEQLVQAAGTFSPLNGMNSFLPVLERVSFSRPFLTEIPWSGAKNLVPWISGVNSNELGILIYAMGKRFNGQLKFNLSQLLYYDFTTRNPRDITVDIESYYGFTTPVTIPQASAATKAGTDGMFAFPNYQCHQLHKGWPSFNYYFNYVATAQRNRPVKGVYHTEELQYLFIRENKNIRLTGSQQDKDVSQKLVNLWLEFVINPYNTPQSVGSDVHWDKYDSSANNVLAIDETGFNMVTDPNLQGNQFWQILPFRELMP